MSATGNPVLGIDVVAKLDQLRAELAKIGPEGAESAKALTAAYARELKNAEKAAKDAATKSAEAAKSTKALGEAVDATGRAAVKFRGAASALSPELGNLLGNVDDAADGVEGLSLLLGGSLTAALGAAAIAIAGAYAAWRIYNEDADRAAETAAMVAEAHKAVTPFLDAARDATVDLAEATGQLSEMEADLERNSRRVQKAVADAVSETAAKIKSLHDQQASFTTQLVDMAEDIVPSWTPLGVAIDGLTTDSAELQGQIDGLQGAIVDVAKAGKQEKDVTEEVIKAKARHKAATDAQSAAEKALKEALAETNAALEAEQAAAEEGAKSYAEALASIEEAERKAREGQLDEIGKVEAAREKELADLQAKVNQAVAIAADGSDAEATAIAEGEQAKQAIVEESEAKIAKLRADAAKKAADEARDSAAEMAAAYESVAQSIAGMFGEVSSAMSTGAEELTKTHRRAAKMMFQASKIAALSEAFINIALAETQALTLPPPLDVAKQTIVAATGAIEVAAIAAEEPPFHAGGVAYGARSSDEQVRRFLPGEGALNRQAVDRVGGPGAVNALNGGAPMAAGTSLRIGRLEAREIARTDIVSGGAIPAAIRRAVAKGTTLAGRSGRAPVA